MALTLSSCSSSQPSLHGAQEPIEIGSSSPRLPSPTSFLRERQLALKSGTNASQVPEGAALGFIKASRIRFEEEQAARLQPPGTTANGTSAGLTLPTDSAVDNAPKSGRLVKPGKRTNGASTEAEDQHGPANTNNAQPRKGTSPDGQVAQGVKKPRRKATKAAVSGAKPASKAEDTVLSHKPHAEETVSGAAVKASGPKQCAPRKKRKSDEIAGEDCPKKQKKQTKKPRRSSDGDVVVVEGPTLNASKNSSQSARVVGNDAGDVISTAQNVSEVDDESQVTELDPAPRRRRSWTPVNDSMLPPSHQEVSEPLMRNESPSEFSTLVEQYNFQAGLPQSAQDSGNAVTIKNPAKRPTKKKPVEGVKGVRAPRKPKPSPKGKAATAKPDQKSSDSSKKPRKKTASKPQTVTNHSLAQYNPQPQDVDEGPSASIEHFLLAVNKEQEAEPTDIDNEATATDTNRTNKKPKKGKQKADAKKGQQSAQALVLPQVACEKMMNQDFLFGTSSQLAKDDSPTMFRQIQIALAESEETAFASQQIDRPTTSRWKVAAAPHGTSLSLGRTESNLWTVSARLDAHRMFAGLDPGLENGPETVEAEGQLHEFTPISLPEQGGDIEVTKTGSEIDDTNTHKMPGGSSVEDDHDDERQDSGFLDLSSVEAKEGISESAEDVERVCKANASPTMVDAPRMQQDEQRPALQTLNANIQPQHGSGIVASKVTATARLPQDGKPSLEASLDLPDSVLTKQPLVKKPRGRPRKDQGDHSVITVSVKVQVPKKKDQSAPSTPKRKKTTKKPQLTPDGSSPFVSIDEIEDSESEGGVSPFRRLTSSSPQKALRTLQLSPDPSDPTRQVLESTIADTNATAKTADSTASIFAAITTTIKSAPRTKDVKQPSWNEKILRYDPIVLEDLTEWLNAQGLRIEGPPVKHAKRPKTKKTTAKELDMETVAADVGKLETVMKELDPPLVQRWCEAHSVCCLWKEGLRGGVRQKY